MAAARGNWLALLDADDGFAPDRLARLVALGEARGADIVVDNLRLVTAKGRVLGDALRRGDPIFAEGLSAAAFVRRNHFLTTGFKLGYLKPLFRRSEEHTSELQSLMRTSYAVFCLKTKNN